MMVIGASALPEKKSSSAVAGLALLGAAGACVGGVVPLAAPVPVLRLVATPKPRPKVRRQSVAINHGLAVEAEGWEFIEEKKEWVDESNWLPILRKDSLKTTRLVFAVRISNGVEH